MLRAGKVVGTSSQGYSQGFREGYLFIVYNHPSSSNSEFRIYKSTASTNLSMMVNQGAGVLPEKGTPMWYRATVKGYPIVTLTFEYSTDGETWVLASQTMDSNNAFSSGRTQVAWGLAAMQHSFYLDDITFEGVTYDPTHVTPTLQSATSAPQSAIYNLKGQRVTSMKAGEIYITNGKKIVK